MSKYVDLDERVTAQFYDQEYEEWTMRTVTIKDVLDRVCDDYTVLSSAPPERKPDKTLAEEIERIKHEIIGIFAEQMGVRPDNKLGYWTVKEGETAFWDVCGECGEKVLHQMPHYKYCPHCGKQMKIY